MTVLSHISVCVVTEIPCGFGCIFLGVPVISAAQS